MTKNISLAKYLDLVTNKEINVTIDKYADYLKSKDKDLIADFIYNRLYYRYLKPFAFKNADYKKNYKNGFSIMANCCLLIETIESFKNGWGDSGNKSELAFVQFFKSDKNFSELKNSGSEFYKKVRCGILHQGETTGGWLINRSGEKLCDSKTINAFKFSRRIELSLNDYKTELKNAEWDSEIWDNFRTKMRKIISNCQN